MLTSLSCAGVPLRTVRDRLIVFDEIAIAGQMPDKYYKTRSQCRSPESPHQMTF